MERANVRGWMRHAETDRIQLKPLPIRRAVCFAISAYCGCQTRKIRYIIASFHPYAVFYLIYATERLFHTIFSANRHFANLITVTVSAAKYVYSRNTTTVNSAHDESPRDVNIGLLYPRFVATNFKCLYTSNVLQIGT